MRKKGQPIVGDIVLEFTSLAIDEVIPVFNSPTIVGASV